MVFYFESEGISYFLIFSENDAVIYMGKDKFENEDLIKYALPHDIWYSIYSS